MTQHNSEFLSDAIYNFMVKGLESSNDLFKSGEKISSSVEKEFKKAHDSLSSVLGEDIRNARDRFSKLNQALIEELQKIVEERELQRLIEEEERTTATEEEPVKKFTGDDIPEDHQGHVLFVFSTGDSTEDEDTEEDTDIIDQYHNLPVGTVVVGPSAWASQFPAKKDWNDLTFVLTNIQSKEGSVYWFCVETETYINSRRMSGVEREVVRRGLPEIPIANGEIEEGEFYLVGDDSNGDILPAVASKVGNHYRFNCIDNKGIYSNDIYTLKEAIPSGPVFKPFVIEKLS